MRRVVVDPSVLVSAAITPRRTPPDLVVRAAVDGAYVLVISQMLVRELESVLGRSKLRRYLSAEDAAEFVERLRRIAHMAQDPKVRAAVVRDPQDDYLVALALASKAEVLVSSDRDLLEADITSPVVVDPKAFLASLARG